MRIDAELKASEGPRGDVVQKPNGPYPSSRVEAGFMIRSAVLRCTSTPRSPKPAAPSSTAIGTADMEERGLAKSHCKEEQEQPRRCGHSTERNRGRSERWMWTPDFDTSIVKFPDSRLAADAVEIEGRQTSPLEFSSKRSGRLSLTFGAVEVPTCHAKSTPVPR